MESCSTAEILLAEEGQGEDKYYRHVDIQHHRKQADTETLHIILSTCLITTTTKYIEITQISDL